MVYLPVVAKRTVQNYPVAVISSVVLVILCSSALGVLLMGRHTNQPLQHDFQAAQKLAAFPLYIPSATPAGYTYTAGSLHSTSSVIVYTLTSPDGKQLAITEQSRPANFDFSQLSGTEEFNTNLGKAYVEDFPTRTTGSVVGDKTWIIVNAPTPIGPDQMSSLLNAFRPLE